MGQLLRYKLNPPPFLEKTVELHQYMATEFVDTVRTCLKDGGFASKENEVESAGHFLVGIRGRLFTVQSDYQVGESLDEFDSCGCGYQIARGSLFSTSGMPAKDRVRVALEAAERYSAGVRGPFIIEESVSRKRLRGKDNPV